MTITLDKPSQRRLEAQAKREGRDLEEVAECDGFSGYLSPRVVSITDGMI